MAGGRAPLAGGRGRGPPLAAGPFGAGASRPMGSRAGPRPRGPRTAGARPRFFVDFPPRGRRPVRRAAAWLLHNLRLGRLTNGLAVGPRRDRARARLFFVFFFFFFFFGWNVTEWPLFVTGLWPSRCTRFPRSRFSRARVTDTAGFPSEADCPLPPEDFARQDGSVLYMRRPNSLHSLSFKSQTSCLPFLFGVSSFDLR
jgi:hypothetical protein